MTIASTDDVDYRVVAEEVEVLMFGFRNTRCPGVACTATMHRHHFPQHYKPTHPFTEIWVLL